jgi:hypothetical protein
MTILQIRKNGLHSRKKKKKKKAERNNNRKVKPKADP